MSERKPERVSDPDPARKPHPGRTGAADNAPAKAIVAIPLRHPWRNVIAVVLVLGLAVFLLDAAQRPPHRPPVADVGHHRLHVEALQRVQARGRAHGDPHVVATRRQGADDVRADEPGRARDEGGGHRALRLPPLRPRQPATTLPPCPRSPS